MSLKHNRRVTQSVPVTGHMVAQSNCRQSNSKTVTHWVTLTTRRPR
uniref:Uncharacterized protein n=1 Tax=Anguilla anguilla TaxID=7936 RepID=A0A0E9VIN6_ANGAN